MHVIHPLLDSADLPHLLISLPHAAVQSGS
jgi:hypothetical protein